MQKLVCGKGVLRRNLCAVDRGEFPWDLHKEKGKQDQGSCKVFQLRSEDKQREHDCFSIERRLYCKRSVAQNYISIILKKAEGFPSWIPQKIVCYCIVLMCFQFCSIPLQKSREILCLGVTI